MPLYPPRSLEPYKKKETLLKREQQLRGNRSLLRCGSRESGTGLNSERSVTVIFGISHPDRVTHAAAARSALARNDLPGG